jgi:DNA 3'-phosphatase
MEVVKNSLVDNGITEINDKDRVLFLDLDNTIIVTKSKQNFPKSPDDWTFRYRFLEAFYNYCKNNKIEKVVIITNQAGIEEGYVTPVEFRDKITLIIDNIKQYLYFRGASDRQVLDIHIYMIPSVSFNFKFRKPNTEVIKFLN